MYIMDMGKDVNRAACLGSQKRSASSISRFDVSAYGARPVRIGARQRCCCRRESRGLVKKSRLRTCGLCRCLK